MVPILVLWSLFPVIPTNKQHIKIIPCPHIHSWFCTSRNISTKLAMILIWNLLGLTTSKLLIPSILTGFKNNVTLNRIRTSRILSHCGFKIWVSDLQKSIGTRIQHTTDLAYGTGIPDWNFLLLLGGISMDHISVYHLSADWVCSPPINFRGFSAPRRTCECLQRLL